MVSGSVQGSRECHTHLGLQRGQHHRSGFLYVGDLNGHFLRSGRAFSAVGCLNRNYVGVDGAARSSALRALKVGGTLECCSTPFIYGEVLGMSIAGRPESK